VRGRGEGRVKQRLRCERQGKLDAVFTLLVLPRDSKQRLHFLNSLTIKKRHMRLGSLPHWMAPCEPPRPRNKKPNRLFRSFLMQRHPDDILQGADLRLLIASGTDRPLRGHFPQLEMQDKSCKLPWRSRGVVHMRGE
jgi:hypothetical protein